VTKWLLASQGQLCSMESGSYECCHVSGSLYSPTQTKTGLG